VASNVFYGRDRRASLGRQRPDANDIVGAAGGHLRAIGDDRDRIDRRQRFEFGKRCAVGDVPQADRLIL
jgi:hypothetical protein